MKSQTSWLLSQVDDPSLKIQINYIGVCRGEIHVGQFGSDILFKIVVNDVLNNLSMMVVTSFRSSGPCNKEIIEYDLEENIKYKFINIKFLFLFQTVSSRSCSRISSTISMVVTSLKSSRPCRKDNEEIIEYDLEENI